VVAAVDQMTLAVAVVLVPGWKEPLLSEIQQLLLLLLVVVETLVV
jgi:hypothetical protein